MLASAQIKLKGFDAARLTIARLHNVLEVDFKNHFDQDPLERIAHYVLGREQAFVDETVYKLNQVSTK